MKSLQQRILELETIFNINLTKRNDRTRIIFIFRMIIIEEYADEPIVFIGRCFNLHSSEVASYQTALKNYKGKSEQYEKIYNAIQNLDPSVNFEKQIIHKSKPDPVVVKMKEERKIFVLEMKSKIPIFDVLDILRKDVKSTLWNKRISDWNDKDWQKLYSIKNPAT